MAGAVVLVFINILFLFFSPLDIRCFIENMDNFVSSVTSTFTGGSPFITGGSEKSVTLEANGRFLLAALLLLSLY